MAKFILELNAVGWYQAKYLHRNEAKEFLLVGYNDLDKTPPYDVNSQLRTEVINDYYNKPIIALLQDSGRERVSVNMVRVDEGSLSLSGKYKIYRAWNVAMHQSEERLIWTPIQ
ncbi:hypothetical protein PHABIO_409 [Pseudomonas phage Phabio]|uniref:Uncharacterized protein n=1 Tax=Pseudomonas phage Phabio TaxID=2006668 RepID=A0A1Y0SUL0_9CAUD|nr:hypothetical protein MZD05_gp409 [Pseudomonas phage Phabio]ARV77040.1 hypothetical protein PHABIO_409 [Pseudomonas phage Phabio]